MLPRKKEGQKAQNDSACERCQSRNYHRIVFHVLLHNSIYNDRQILKMPTVINQSSLFCTDNACALCARIKILGRLATTLKIAADNILSRCCLAGIDNSQASARTAPNGAIKLRENTSTCQRKIAILHGTKGR